MVSLKGSNPVSGDSVDATNPRDWSRYVVGGVVLVGSLMAAKAGIDMASTRLNLREKAEESLPSLT